MAYPFKKEKIIVGSETGIEDDDRYKEDIVITPDQLLLRLWRMMGEEVTDSYSAVLEDGLTQLGIPHTIKSSDLGD